MKYGHFNIECILIGVSDTRPTAKNAETNEVIKTYPPAVSDVKYFMGRKRLKEVTFVLWDIPEEAEPFKWKMEFGRCVPIDENDIEPIDDDLSEFEELREIINTQTELINDLIKRIEALEDN